ncbi:MAG TPA: hypothetical protein VFR31_09060 [Thermoanaerobaculia bacterium]|nr:hypothetical protein [Thermoanaerobaculia bacterium]
MSDFLIRLFGGDPETFRPMYRARLQMIRRRARIVQSRKREGSGGGSSPFLTLCLFSGGYGLFFLLLATYNVPLLGAGIALTLGCAFLLLIVVTEHFDVLVDPREARVLAAHPHDDRSFLLAKLAVIGNSLAILGALLFGPTAVALGVRLKSIAAPFAFLAGAAGAVMAACASGMLIAALILHFGGRKALERMMPWFQVLFQVGYLLIIGSERAMRILTSPDALGMLLWSVPSFWFLAPVELVAGRPVVPALERLLLAGAVLAVVLGIATRWLGQGLGERLLEPVENRSVPKARRRSPRPSRGDRGRLLSLLRVHLRSDWRTRSELLVMPLLLVAWLFMSLDREDAASLPMPVVLMFTWVLLISAGALTRSMRPDTLWFILVSPIDRLAFSLGTIPLLRGLLLAPALAGLFLLELRIAAPLEQRGAELLQMLVMGDLMLLLGKGFFPAFPFSQPSQAEGSESGQRTASILLAGLASTAIGVLATVGFGRFGTPGYLTGALVFGLLRFPVAAWARRRSERAIDRLELTALSPVS